MKASQNHGIISDHFCGVGTVTREQVMHRAREIALINGRTPNHFTRDDFLQAKRELTGATGDAGDEEAITSITAWDENPTDSGRAAEKETATDEQMLAEELVEQGINEAEHDQMVEGARTQNNQE